MVSHAIAYDLLLLALAGERGCELFVSRRNARRTLERGGMESGSGHYRAMVITHTLFLVSCAVENHVRQAATPILMAAMSLSGLVAAQGLRYWAVATLGDRWNTRIISISSEPPITAGPYRFMRHPNYLAVIIEFACVPLIRGLWFAALTFSAANALLLIVRIPAEERALGERYDAIFASRSRLVPKIPIDPE